MSSPTPPIPPADDPGAAAPGAAAPGADVARAAAGRDVEDGGAAAVEDGGAAPVEDGGAAPAGRPWWSLAAFALAAVTVVAVVGLLVPQVRAPNVLGPVAIVLAVVGLRRGEGRVARAALWTSVGAVALQLLVPVLGWVGLVLWSVNAS